MREKKYHCIYPWKFSEIFIVAGSAVFDLMR